MKASSNLKFLRITKPELFGLEKTQDARESSRFNGRANANSGIGILLRVLFSKTKSTAHENDACLHSSIPPLLNPESEKRHGKAG